MFKFCIVILFIFLCIIVKDIIKDNNKVKRNKDKLDYKLKNNSMNNVIKLNKVNNQVELTEKRTDMAKEVLNSTSVNKLVDNTSNIVESVVSPATKVANNLFTSENKNSNNNKKDKNSCEIIEGIDFRDNQSKKAK